MQNFVYRERVTPSLPSYLLALLTGLGFTAVFLPLLAESAVFIGLVACVLVVLTQIYTSPVIEITHHALRVGRARIERQYLGNVQVFIGAQKRDELGVKLDARAFMRIQGSAPQVVKVGILDKEDPVPYWIFSTRHGAKIIELLDQPSHS